MKINSIIINEFFLPWFLSLCQHLIPFLGSSCKLSKNLLFVNLSVSQDAACKFLALTKALEMTTSVCLVQVCLQLIFFTLSWLLWLSLTHFGSGWRSGFSSEILLISMDTIQLEPLNTLLCFVLFIQTVPSPGPGSWMYQIARNLWEWGQLGESRGFPI